MNPYSTFISLLFASRTQAHVFHLQTNSYAMHKALNGYYDNIIDLADGLVESYQGRHGILYNYTSPATIIEKASKEEVIAYFTNLDTMVESLRKELVQDSYIQNQIDNVVELINGTLYKLKYLQ